MSLLDVFRRRTSTTPNGHGPRPGTLEASVPFGDEALEARIGQIGRELLESARRHRAGLLSRGFWSDKLMDWSMKDAGFKTQLFRFVDAFPTLKTPEQIHEHLVDYLSQPGVTPPPGMDLGLKAGGIAKGVMARTIAGQITGMAEKFIAGADAASALPTLRKRWDAGLAFSVDLLGEACISDAEAFAYQQQYLDLVNNLPEAVAAWPANNRLERDHLGSIPRTNVSVKVSSMSARTDPIDFDGCIARCMETLLPILQAAAQKNVHINFDMESYATKDLTITLFEKCAEEVDFTGGLALQAYLRSGEADARRIADWANRTGRAVTVRLVKGAYWDYETIHAEMMGWPTPVWSRKRDSDACFERMARVLIDACPRQAGQGGTKPALGSHNARSLAASLAYAEHTGLPQEAVEVQMLYGMADGFKAAAIDRGLRVREYVPVGQMLPGMAYLVRRLLENTSNESWLRAGSNDTADADLLLASPHSDRAAPAPKPRDPQRHRLSQSLDELGEEAYFSNAAPRDFADARQRTAFGLSARQAHVPRVELTADEAAAREAVRVAHEAFPHWRDTDPHERARCLLRAADLMAARRDELAGVVIKENGKTWRDADGDVCEAIDFCRFYAREAPGLFEPRRLGRFVGELDEVFYQPRGVAAVIAPWNFPLAIACGMSVAALVTGNSVVLKPAEQTPGCAKVLVDVLHEAGVPADVLQLLPGPGETAGATLVRDGRVSLICFTGSKAVGLDIVRAAGMTPAEQPHVKRVICEMGGKNAVIVDATADLDEAVVAVRDSAFGFAGQKCSACSRAIVVRSAHEPFVRRLVEATRSLKIGDPLDPSTDVGPVIDEEAAGKIRSYIDIGRQEGQLALAMDPPAGLAERVGKPFVGPHVFTGIEPEHRLANEEVFGPVLAVIEVPDFKTALRVANGTAYKLTGGVFTRKPSHIEQARRDFGVGNLYINRGITGALVGRQPFGGFGLSGIGSKAGGQDYLLQFVEPRAVCENTMRRGFAPGLEG